MQKEKLIPSDLFFFSFSALFTFCFFFTFFRCNIFSQLQFHGFPFTCYLNEMNIGLISGGAQSDEIRARKCLLGFVHENPLDIERASKSRLTHFVRAINTLCSAFDLVETYHLLQFYLHQVLHSRSHLLCGWSRGIP